MQCLVPLGTPPPLSALGLLHPLGFGALAAVSGQVEGMPIGDATNESPNLTCHCRAPHAGFQL